MPPTTQMRRMSFAEPRSAARNPVDVKMPWPTILEITKAVALRRPSWRRSEGRSAARLSGAKLRVEDTTRILCERKGRAARNATRPLRLQAEASQMGSSGCVQDCTSLQRPGTCPHALGHIQQPAEMFRCNGEAGHVKAQPNGPH